MVRSRRWSTASTSDVDQGEVVGLLGPNGAGKTTSFRMTIGLIEADGGKVASTARRHPLPMYQRARAGMGYLPRIRVSSASSPSRTT